MTTHEDVIDVISRIEKAGYAGEATRAAQLELLLSPPQDYDHIVARLQAAFPQLFPSAGRALEKPPPDAVPEQQGVAVRAMRQAETALAHQQSAIADFDRQVIEALLGAHKTTGEGRALLDDLETQIECAARSWDLSTAAGAREFQRFLITKLDQVIRVVVDANDDAQSKRALAAAWAALYAAQAGPEESTATGRGDPPGMSATLPQDLSDVAVDPYLGVLPPDELEPAGADLPQRGVPIASAIPAMPGLGGPVPGGGAVPAGGIAGGLPPTGLLHGLQRVSSPAQLGDEPLDPDGDRIAADDAPSGESAEEDDDAADTSPGSGPTTVTLPDGETVTAATPQLAAVIQAAAGGTPIAEAFRQQGITIPPPGSAVSGPVDQSRVSPGDIGMFTDRHALAVGNSKALLDGQIQQITNVGGPSFLGWQHPPMVGEMAAPAPTRLSATLRA